MKRRGYYVKSYECGIVKEPREVDGVSEALRIASDETLSVGPAAAQAGLTRKELNTWRESEAWAWWYVESWTAPDAYEEAKALAAGSHPEQAEIGAFHASIRAGLVGCSPAPQPSPATQEMFV